MRGKVKRGAILNAAHPLALPFHTGKLDILRLWFCCFEQEQRIANSNRPMGITVLNFLLTSVGIKFLFSVPVRASFGGRIERPIRAWNWGWIEQRTELVDSYVARKNISKGNFGRWSKFHLCVGIQYTPNGTQGHWIFNEKVNLPVFAILFPVRANKITA